MASNTATDICLPILKYSHATGLRENNTVPWTHIFAADLFVVVKGTTTRTVDGNLVLRIIQGTKVLESVDIASHVDNAIEIRRRNEQAGINVKVEQLPIMGTTKETALAMRYNLKDGQGRRLQLRMQNVAECRQLVDCFVRRGMEFQEQRPKTGRTNDGRQVTELPQNRPLTVQSSSPSFNTGQTSINPRPFTQHQVLEAGSLSQYQVSPEHSPTRGSTVFEKGGAAQYEVQPSAYFRRDEVNFPREAVPERPSTSQIYRSYTTPSQQYGASDPHFEQSESIVEQTASKSQWSGFDARDAATLQHQSTNHHVSSVASQSHDAPYSNEPWSSMPAASSTSTLRTSDPAEPRLQTARRAAVATSYFPHTLEHEIPPRRELPLRPESWSDARNRTDSRALSSSLTLPPLPKPTLAREPSTSLTRQPSFSPTKTTSPSRPTTSSPLKRSFQTSAEELARPDTVAGLMNPDISHQPPPKRSIQPIRAKSRSINELICNPMPQPKLPKNNPPRLNSLLDASHEIISPPSSPQKAVDQETTSTQSRDPTLRAYATIAGRDPQAPSLQGYTAYSEEDRRAALESFFIRNWDNEEFIALVEDVENCWRRIAVGL